MNDNEKKFENFVRDIRFDDSPNIKHRDKLEKELLVRLTRQQRRPQLFPQIWRKIMKTKIAKLTAAAAIIIIAALAITFWEKSASTAWAIEQTIKALERFNAVHISGEIATEGGPQITFNLWARANEDHTQSANFRLKLGNGQVRAVKGNDTYHYDPNTNTVRIIRGEKAAVSPWIGPDLFQQLEALTQDWQVSYGTDAATGRDRAFVTCSHQNTRFSRSWWFEFDTESKLPVRFKQWNKLKREGKPDFDAQMIVFYESLPDEQFEFEIPQDAMVTEEFPTPRGFYRIDDPNFGMMAESMTENEASVEIVKQYWQAVIEADWELVENLRPVATAGDWQQKYGINPPMELVEVGQPYQQDGCSIGPIVPCTVSFEDGTTRQIKTIIKFRQIDGKSSCVIAGTWGKE